MRKLIFIGAIVGGAWYYLKNNVDMEKTLAWAKARPVAADREKYVYYVGMIYYVKDKQPEAAAVFKEILTEEATGQYEAKALMRMARCYQETRSFEEARIAYERYIEMFPKGDDIEIVKNNYEFVKFK